MHLVQYPVDLFFRHGWWSNDFNRGVADFIDFCIFLLLLFIGILLPRRGKSYGCFLAFLGCSGILSCFFKAVCRVWEKLTPAFPALEFNQFGMVRVFFTARLSFSRRYSSGAREKRNNGASHIYVCLHYGDKKWFLSIPCYHFPTFLSIVL